MLADRRSTNKSPVKSAHWIANALTNSLLSETVMTDGESSILVPELFYFAIHSERCLQ